MAGLPLANMLYVWQTVEALCFLLICLAGQTVGVLHAQWLPAGSSTATGEGCDGRDSCMGCWAQRGLMHLQLGTHVHRVARPTRRLCSATLWCITALPPSRQHLASSIQQQTAMACIVCMIASHKASVVKKRKKFASCKHTHLCKYLPCVLTCPSKGHAFLART